MEDMNWKTWAIIFIIAMGAGLEAIKRLPSNKALDLERMNGIPGSTPYSVKMRNAPMVIGGAPRTLPAPKAVTIAGQTISRETLEKFVAANTPEKTDFDKVLKGMADKNAANVKKKKDKDGEEYEIIVDPKTGKRYKRKKKKGAKAEKKKEEEVAKEEPKKEEPEEDDKSIDDLLNEAIASGQLPAPPNKPDTPFADFEEWKRRLLTQPDPAETRTFIDHFRNNLVTPEIYYKISTLMIQDSRPAMKELGILCAGSSPSVTSFNLLTEVWKTERSGSKTRNYADGFLAAYSQPGNLNTLQQVMRSPSNNDVALLATKKLDVAATTLLAPNQDKKKAPAATQTTTASTAKHSNAGYFTPFKPILEKLARGTDATVASQAKSTLETMQRLMYPNANPAPAQTQIHASLERW